MKYYAQFFQWSTGYIAGTIPPQFGKPKLIESCGDRSIINIDARLAKSTIGEIAAIECEKRGYVAWQIIRGHSLRDAKPVSQRNYIHSSKVDNSAMSATYGA